MRDQTATRKRRVRRSLGVVVSLTLLMHLCLLPSIPLSYFCTERPLSGLPFSTISTSNFPCTIIDQIYPFCLKLAMSVVSLLGVKLLNNPATFLAPYQFEITFECLEQLQKGKY